MALLTKASFQEIKKAPGNSNSGGGSKAWIAGPLIGAILAFLLIAGGVFWYRRRRSRPNKSTKVVQVESSAYPKFMDNAEK